MPPSKGSRAPGNDGLAVTSIGMVTSVGLGAARACASVRAGLARPSPLPYFDLVDSASGEAAPVIGHPIRGFTDGFHIVGRWLRMAEGVVGELLAAEASAEPLPATAIIAALPIRDAGRFGIDEEESAVDDATLIAAFVDPLCEITNLPVAAEDRSVVCEGHAATASAFSRAGELLARGQVEQVIVLGADSYLDPETLDWLAAQDRLHGPAQPEGFAPGEAAAGLVVTTARRCSMRGERPLAYVSAASSSLGAERSMQDGAGRGAEWADACARLLEHPAAEGAADVLVDLNGERWRGEAFGHGLARVSRLGSRRPRIATPATSLGDVGASTGCVHACLAVRSLLRHYSAGTASIVMNQSDDGRVGAILLQAA